MLQIFLAVIGAVLGLVATGGLVYAVWLIMQHRKATSNEISLPFPVKLLKWTVMDYIVIVLFGFGLLLLFADLAAVLRDRSSYREWHLAYLASGVILSFMGMIMMFMRLLMLQNAVRSLSLPAQNNECKPNHRDDTE